MPDKCYVLTTDRDRAERLACDVMGVDGEAVQIFDPDNFWSERLENASRFRLFLVKESNQERNE